MRVYGCATPANIGVSFVDCYIYWGYVGCVCVEAAEEVGC